MAVSKTTKSILIGLGIFVSLILVGVIAIAVAVGTVSKPHVQKNSVLVLKVAGSMPDYVAENEMARAFGIAEPMSISSLVTQLRKAKVDDRIGGVIVDINFPDLGWAKAEEIREAIKDFRMSGKPAFAYMELGQNKEYFIATAAEKIFLPPSGDLYVNGFAANAMFYRGTLDKLGVEAEVIQIGKYKNAPDQYTRKDMSPPQREVLNAILDEYFIQLTAAVAESRSKKPDDIKALIDNAPYHADDAKAQGLIDDTLYRDQVYDSMKSRLGYKEDEKLRTVNASDYREIPADSLGINKGEKVAVIYAAGTINVGSSSSSAFGGDNVGSDTIVKAVNSAASDDSVKAIVLRVDSPGGSALASDLMWHALENAKAKKPVVVSMSDVAASGGYYISCNASKIVAQQTTITGSIGVFMGKPVIKGMYDWMGISNEYVLRGKNAGIFRETEKWTPDERAKMQQAADKIYYNDFVPKVAKGRNLTDEAVNSIGQGHVWTGTQAKANGLVDEIGGLEKAISIAKELAGIPAEKEVRRVAYPEPKTFLEELFGTDDSTQAKEQEAKAAIAASLPADMRRAFYWAELFERMRNGEAMLMMPFRLEIK